MADFVSASGFGDLRAAADVTITYEGENNVLIQQASNWLLGIRSKGFSYFNERSPLESAKFLADGEHILKKKFAWKSTEDAIKPESIVNKIFLNSNFKYFKTF